MRYGWWLCLCLLSACSLQPEKVADSAAQIQMPGHWLARDSSIPAVQSLLGLVEEPAISQWVAQVLTDNPAINQEILAFAEAEALVRQAGAARLPSISVSAGNSKQRAVAENATGTAYSLGLSASWEVDVWQRLGDSRNAAMLDSAALAADLAYARQSLVANAIKQWLTLLNARAILAVETARTAVLVKNEQSILSRYQSGIGRLDDLRSARADTLQARAAVAAADAQVAAAERGLQTLQGALGSFDELPADWPEVGFPMLDLPASALALRPDIVAAMRRIEAADSRSSAAYKQLLPGFSLTLDVNRETRSYRDLLHADPAWSLLSQLTQPLFNGGRLRAELAAAEQRAGQAYWAYRELLLTAVLEVDAALTEERSLARQQSVLEAALLESRAAQRLFEQRYRQGLVSVLEMLNAQRNTFDVELRLQQVLLARAANRVDLGLALGLPIETQEEEG